MHRPPSSPRALHPHAPLIPGRLRRRRTPPGRRPVRAAGPAPRPAHRLWTRDWPRPAQMAAAGRRPLSPSPAAMPQPSSMHAAGLHLAARPGRGRITNEGLARPFGITTLTNAAGIRPSSSDGPRCPISYHLKLRFGRARSCSLPPTLDWSQQEARTLALCPAISYIGLARWLPLSARAEPLVARSNTVKHLLCGRAFDCTLPWCYGMQFQRDLVVRT